MTLNRFAKTAAALLITSVAGLSAAATSDTQPLTVTATVQAVCRLAVTNITFTIDPSSTGPLTGSSNLSYRCTNGTTPSSFSAVGGLTGRTLTRAVGSTMTYDLSLPAPTAGTGFSGGAAQTILLTATVAQAQYQNAVAGDYTETLNLTINP